MKIRTNILQLEALLFGVAGYLKGEPIDDYTKSLQAEYHFLKHKFSFDNEMSKEEWRFSKMHPVNFPTIRIAQFAQMLHQNASLFSVIKEHLDYFELENMFTLKASDYWDTHFVFGKISPKRTKKIGKDSIQILVINAVASLLYAFGKQDENYKEKAFDLLNVIAAEENSTTKKYRAAGLQVENAYTSQALIQLKESYCDAKKCLHCTIGNYLTKT